MLSAASGGIQLQDDTALTSLDVPELLLTGVFRATDDTVLTSITAPRLAVVAVDVDLADLPMLQTASFPVLGPIGGSLLLQGVPLANFSGFSTVTSVGGQMWIQGEVGDRLLWLHVPARRQRQPDDHREFQISPHSRGSRA